MGAGHHHWSVFTIGAGRCEIPLRDCHVPVASARLRADLPLANTGRAYYGDHLAGTVTATDFGTVGSASGEVATTLAQPLVKHLQRLNQIRRAVPALQTGQYSTDGISGQMAFKRRYTSGSTDSFALVTVTGDATYTSIPNGTYNRSRHR